MNEGICKSIDGGNDKRTNHCSLNEVRNYLQSTCHVVGHCPLPQNGAILDAGHLSFLLPGWIVRWGSK